MAPGMGAGSSDGRHDDEAVLTEFVSSLMDYNPMIPDELVEHYLGRSGFHCPDLRLTRLVAVATQKFISDIASDSLQHCKARVAAPIKDNKSKQPKDRRLVLTMDDLSKALRELGTSYQHTSTKAPYMKSAFKLLTLTRLIDKRFPTVLPSNHVLEAILVAAP
ncbi:hypothetical protein ACQJBY_049737 [Aegilops geniculata]